MIKKSTPQLQSHTRRKVLGSVLAGIPVSADILGSHNTAWAAVSWVPGGANTAPQPLRAPSITVWRAAK